MKKLSLVGGFVKSTSRNERNLNAERARTRALRLEGLESRELLSVSPGSELLAADALAVYESRVATPDDVLDLSAAALDDVAPETPEYLTVTAPDPVGATATPLATPTLTVGAKTESTITVNWNAVANADRYSLSYKPSSETTWTNKNVGTNTSYTVSGLDVNTNYDFRLKAIGDGVNYKSVYSSIVTAKTEATTPSGPVALPTPVLTAEATATAITISWDAVPNAERYSLSYKPSTETTWTSKNVGTSTSYTITGLDDAASYNFRLKAIGDGVNYKSVYSSIITVVRPTGPVALPTPVLTVAEKSSSTITITWDAVANAERYSLSYKLASETTWTNKNVGTNTSYTISGLDAETEYDVRLKAIADGVVYKSVYSPIVRVATDPTIIPLDPPVLTADPAVTIMTVSWDAVENAERYSLAYRPTGETTWTNVNVGTNTSYAITGLTADAEYDVRVKAIGDGVNYKSVYSPILRAKTASSPVALPTPVLTVESAPTSLTVSWNEVPNAERYSLSYKLSSETAWTNVNVGTDTSYAITGLTLGVDYDLRLKAIGDGVNYKSVYSALVVGTTKAVSLVPPQIAANPTATSATLVWDVVPNAERYSVSYRRAGETEWTNKNAGTNTSCVIEGLDPTTEYEARVKAIGDGVNYKSVYSEIITFTTTEGDWPSITTTDVSNDSILLHWNALQNAVEYRVEWAPVGSTNFAGKTVAAPTSYARITGLAANTGYQIKIRATTYEGTTDFSPAITLTTSSTPFEKTALAVPTVSTRGISSDALYVEWEANPRATGYIVSYKERTADAYTTVNVPASENGLVLSGLGADATYYVRVKAVGDNVFWSSSVYSAAQSVKTQDASFLSSDEYGDLRDRYNQLTLPESMADVNIIVPTDWTAQAIIDAIEVARSTPIDDVILLEPDQYSNEVLDLSGVSITLDVAYETSGAISILTRGMDRAQVKVNGSEATFHAVAGLTQFGGFDFVDVNPEVAVYHASVVPVQGTVPTTITTQNVGMYTPAGVSVKGATKNFVRDAPTVSTTLRNNDYALLFVGGGDPWNNIDEFYITLRDYYFELVEEFSFDPTKIYILYADGCSDTYNMNNGYWFMTSDMSFATDIGTTVCAATGSNLTSTLGEIASLMTADSHLLFYTEDHGDGAPGDHSDPYDYLCGWDDGVEDVLISSETVRDALFQIQEGYVTCVFTQCFSGGILDDIFDLSTGTVSSAYTGSAHFVGGAAANHYEYSRYDTNSYGDYIGYPQTFEEALRQCSTGVEAFIYTEQNDPFSAAYGATSPSYLPNQGTFTNGRNEHPWHIGETFSIFAPKPIPDPEKPTFTSHSETSTTITVNWSEVQGATSYTLQYVVAGASDDDSETIVITTENGVLPTTYEATRLTPATEYVFRVTADNSNYSDPLSVWTKEPEPEPASTVVTTDEDVVNAYDGLISLREAISKYAVAGDTITFAPNLQGKTIKLDSSRGSLNVTKSLTIDASNLYDENAQTPGVKISGEDAVEILYLAGGRSLLVKGVEFTHGYSSVCGGAIWNSGDLTVEDCVFSANNANNGSSFGGAIAVKSGATLTANSSYFTGNIGAGVVSFQSDNSESYFTDCVFEQNDAISIYDMYGAVSMLNCVVKDNSNTGIVVSTNGYVSAVNCLIVDNTASWGAGLDVYGFAELVNCTVAGNAATRKGGGVYVNDGAFFHAINSIIAGNTAQSGGADVNLYGSDPWALCLNSLSSFTDWSEQENAYVYDATKLLFYNAANGDYTLAASSQALNKGNDEYVPEGVTTDLAGNNRISGSGVDLGAYEFQNPDPIKKLATPTNVAATSTLDSITVTWNAVDHAASYQLEYKLANAPDWTTWSSTITETSDTITGLQEGTQYSVRVTALSGDQPGYLNSDPSQPVELRTKKHLDPPTNVVATSDLVSITVAWDAVADSAGYKVRYALSGTNSWSNWTTVQNALSWTTQVPFDSNGPAGGKTYNVEIVAVATGGDVDSNAATTTVTTKTLLAPTISSSSSTTNSITFAWNPVPYATGYTIKYRPAGTSDWIPAGTTTDTTMTIGGLQPSTTYEVVLTSTAGDYHSEESSPYSITTKSEDPTPDPVPLDAPTITKVEQQTITVEPNLNTAKVTWTAVANASGYTLYYKKSSESSWTVVTGITSTSYTLSNKLVGATDYNFKVVAKGDGTNYLDSVDSAVFPKVIQAKLATPTNVSVDTSVPNQATISWNPVNGVRRYLVSIKKSSESDWSTSVLVGRTTATNDTSLTFRVLDGATQYDFKVVAEGDRTYRIDSDPAIATNKIVKDKLTPKPTITEVVQQTFTVKPGLNSAKVTWTATPNASSYTLSYKKSSDSNWTPVAGITSTSYTITNKLEGATPYNFKVVAVGDGTWRVNSDESAVFDKVIAAKLPTPSGFVVTGHSDKTVSIKWNAVANATGYVVRIVGGGQDWTQNATSTSLSIGNLNPTTQYTFYVKAKGDGVYYVDSDWAGPLSVKTKETPSVVVNSIADTVDAYDGQITLREALTTYSAQGSTVTFASNMSGQTINLNSQIAPSTSKAINASALSSPVKISGQQKTRIFSLSGTNQTYTITKVNFTQGKITSGGGGAINITGSGARLVANNCAFTNNSELGAAGSGNDEDNTGNFTTQGGGAIYVGNGARIDATNCTFSGNQTTQGSHHRGGAVHLYGGSVGNFTACTIKNNKSLFGGGVTYSEDCTGAMTNCLIVQNEASQRGGGVAVVKNATVNFYNCTIAKNAATNSGSGVYVWSNSSRGNFYNCIIALNESTSRSGHNNIGWNPSMTNAPNAYGWRTLTKNVTWHSGSGNNIEFDGVGAHLFVVPNGDWHIRQDSQAHDAGNNSKYPSSAPSVDLDGRARIYNGTIDLGCYERPAASSALLDDAELFEEIEIEDSLDLIAANLLDVE